MWIDFLLIIFGFALLIFGAEALVRGSCWIALKGHISPAVIGLTIVAAGTSLPELMVSVEAAMVGSDGLSVGNIVGSNIFNIAIILGITAIIKPMLINDTSLRRDWPVMMGATILLFIVGIDRTLNFWDGILMLIAYTVFTILVIYQSKASRIGDIEASGQISTASFGLKGYKETILNISSIFIGIVTLAYGSKLIVNGAQVIANRLGISETIIGLTIIAGGTSLPELITSLVAAYRGRDDIAVANILGSNIFNILGILGLTGILAPINMPKEIMQSDLLWLMVVTIVLLPFMWSGRRLSRIEGLILILLYSFYAYQLVIG